VRDFLDDPVWESPFARWVADQSETTVRKLKRGELRRYLSQDSDSEDDVHPIAAMPSVRRPQGYKPKHRPRIPDVVFPFNACVARPVGKAEIRSEPAAQNAMDKEYNKLRYKVHPGKAKPGCWDESCSAKGRGGGRSAPVGEDCAFWHDLRNLCGKRK
jgi:hypothetical protein